MKKLINSALDITGQLFRKTPYFRGKDFIGRYFVKPVINRLDPEFIISLNSGNAEMICRPKDWIPWIIYLHGYYVKEYQYEQFMLRIAEKCNTIFDVGANIGYYTVQFANNSKDTVYAFEPMTHQFDMLHRNLQLNSITNVHTTKKIVSNRDDQERIFFSGFENTGKSSLVKKTHDYEDISSVTLDSFCENHQIETIDLVKIDVEGYEFKVLEGLKRMLKEGKVTHLFVELLEMNLIQAGSSSQEICDFMYQFGYEVFSIKTGARKTYKVGNSESLVYFRRTDNNDQI